MGPQLDGISYGVGMTESVERDVELSSLPGFNTVEDILKRRSFAGCTTVQQFTIRNRIVGGVFNCHLILDFAHEYDDAEAVRFEFEEIHDLKIGETHQVSGLAIKDVSSRGWDRTRYEVYDYEGDAIRFYCRTIKLSRVTK